MPRKGLGRLPIHDKSAQRVGWVDRAHQWEADSEVGRLSNEYWLHGPSRNRRQVREVELDLEYVVRCVDEIRHVGSSCQGCEASSRGGRTTSGRRHPLTRRD
jgi:hypothetical protein